MDTTKVLYDIMSIVLRKNPAFKILHGIQSKKNLNKLKVIGEKTIINKNLYNCIFDQIHGDKWGVKIICAPSGCGKSTYLTQIISGSILKKSIRSYYYSNYDDLTNNGKNIEYSFLQYGEPYISVPEMCISDFNNLLTESKFKEKLVIVFDQFETLKYERKENSKIVKRFLYNLAEESIRSNNFSVIVSLSDPKIAIDLYEYNTDKVSLYNNIFAFKWNLEDCKEILIICEKQNGEIESELRKLILEYAPIAGTADFIIKSYFISKSKEKYKAARILELCNKKEKCWKVMCDSFNSNT